MIVSKILSVLCTLGILPTQQMFLCRTLYSEGRLLGVNLHTQNTTVVVKVLLDLKLQQFLARFLRLKVLYSDQNPWYIKIL
jgi:hypothetical protein